MKQLDSAAAKLAAKYKKGLDLTSRTLDMWLSNNGYSGEASRMVKNILADSYGWTAARRM